MIILFLAPYSSSLPHSLAAITHSMSQLNEIMECMYSTVCVAVYVHQFPVPKVLLQQQLSTSRKGAGACPSCQSGQRQGSPLIDH